MLQPLFRSGAKPTTGPSRARKRKQKALGGAGAAALMALLGLTAQSNAGVIFYADWVENPNPLEDRDNDAIWTVNFDGSGKTQVLQVDRVIGLALDVPNQYIYYGAGGAGTTGIVGRVKFDGTLNQVLATGDKTNGVTPLDDFDDAQHVRLDLTAGKVYWASYHDGLRRMNLDGTGVEIVEQRDINSGETRGHLDIKNGALYFGSPSSGNVYQGTLTAPTVSAELPVDAAAADFVLNNAADRLYWAAGGTIQSDNLLGTDPVAVVPTTNGSLGITLTPDNSSIVWTERAGGLVRYANIDGTNPQTITTAGNPFGVAVVPEPASLSLIALAGTALFMRRRRMQC